MKGRGKAARGVRIGRLDRLGLDGRRRWFGLRFFRRGFLFGRDRRRVLRPRGDGDDERR